MNAHKIDVVSIVRAMTGGDHPPGLDLEEGDFSVLNDRELKVLVLRFGLTSDPMTLTAVSREIGVTHERVRQIQNIALAKVRRAIQKRTKPAEQTPPIFHVDD